MYVYTHTHTHTYIYRAGYWRIEGLYNIIKVVCPQYCILFLLHSLLTLLGICIDLCNREQRNSNIIQQ